MNCKTLTLITIAAAVMTACCHLSANYPVNRAPLNQDRFIELPLGSIGADGWLHEMLVRQAEGAT
ncbi:MAG: hypothetical protein IJS07_01745, partial [Bacteroidales bacterium]|nr:hypothetical protein [Bacteroidales bacterium]